MSKIKALLIDDEPKALAILKNKIERLCPNLTVIGETQSPKEGLILIEQLKPHLVFLDIAMPEMSGFDVLAKIDNPDFEIIFATAFDNYAIEAINHCAIGYLVKPIDNKLLIDAVNKATINIEQKTALEKNKQLIQNLGIQSFQHKKLVIPSTEGLEFVKIENIKFCEGIDGYTKIHFANQKPILSSNSIGHFKKLLDDRLFYMVHKSYVINLYYIEKYLNEGYVVLEGDHKIPVSRNRRQAFLESFKR